MRESHHARTIAMPDFVLIAVGTLVPILALTLALACGRAREAAADVSADDDARS
jgi:Zn-dependent protease with chaperone function